MRHLGIFLNFLDPKFSTSKDILGPGCALLFSMLKAWWILSVLIIYNGRILRNFLSNYTVTGDMYPELGKSVFVQYYMLLKKNKEANNDIVRYSLCVT